jgi:tetratricopeptide (TPR) repeat protein
VPPAPARAGPGEDSRSRELKDSGIKLYQGRKYFEAISALEEALAAAASESERAELSELLARARSALGVELFNEGEARRAEEAFREALRHAKDSYAHFGLGFLHFIRVEDAAALEHLNQALLLEPGYAKTHKLLGVIDYRQGRTAEAIARMEEARRIDSKDPEAKALLERWKFEGAFTESFREVKEGRFVIRADPALPASRVRDVARKLEAAWKDIGSALGARGPRRIVVVLFTPAGFLRATRSYHWVGGVYDGQIKLPVPDGKTVDPRALRELDEAIRHEIAHAAIREVCPECPNWLNEGIAQHFERKDRGGETRRLLRAGAARKVAFKDVPGRLWEVDDEELARWTYLQGLGFVEHLAGRFHEFRLRLLLLSIVREGSVSQAFEKTYGMNLEAAEAAWWREVEGAAGGGGGPGGPTGGRVTAPPSKG